MTSSRIFCNFNISGSRIILSIDKNDKGERITATNGLNVWSKCDETTNFSLLFSDNTNNNHCDLLYDTLTDEYQLTTKDKKTCVTLSKISLESERNEELQRLLFLFADNSISYLQECKELKEKLKATESKLEASLKKGVGTTVFDMGIESKKKKVTQKTVPKQAGMSVLNPGSKKRAAPKGVNFD